MTELFSALRESLEVRAADDSTQPQNSRAFAAWINAEIGVISPTLKRLAEEVSQLQGAAIQSQHAAVLGYAVASDAQFTDAFGMRLDWLKSRQFFAPGRPLMFEVDGLSLLGVALGLSKMIGAGQRSDDDQAWFIEILQKSLAALQVADWNQSLVAAALSALATTPNAISADLCVALASKEVLKADRMVRDQAWKSISGMEGANDGQARAAAQLKALRFLLATSAAIHPDAVTVADAGKLIHGIERSLRLWPWEDAPRTQNSETTRWLVENEYHVQSLLWVILAPVFPDLEEEEWLRSLGQHHPRSDLVIPSLHLAIEVKFMRAGNPAFSKVIQEVAADASTYLQAGSPYLHLIAVIWDDHARTEGHAELVQGLMRISGIRDVIIISRPSKMARISVVKPALPRNAKGRTT